MKTGRVVISGMGLTSPIGSTLPLFRKNLFEGVSGVGLDTESFDRPYVVARVNSSPWKEGNNAEPMHFDRVSAFAMYAAHEAVASSGLQGSGFGGNSAGIFFGSGFGGATSIEEGYRAVFKGSGRPRPATVPNAMINAAAGHLAIKFHVTGPVVSYSTACASSALAIGEAFCAIRSGRVRRALVVGSEALLTNGLLAAWDSMRVLAQPARTSPAHSCQPFSGNRTGIVLGEGAAGLVLESERDARERGADILAEIIGYGVACDATHITAPSAQGQHQSMQAALADARIGEFEVGYINAHGTGTLVGDRTETLAIKSLFRELAPRIPVSSSKAIHGHLLGAAGVLELIVCACALNEQVLPPTMHLDSHDPECDLDYVPNRRREAKFSVALSNSFAFGGTNVTLAVRRYEKKK